jgi:asparagine synthase (glutamine-hydrolysing)
MCGVAGFFSPTDQLRIGGVDVACQLMRHRGPDDEGFIALTPSGLECFKGEDTIPEFSDLRHLSGLSESQLLLAHRRLAIIDLSAEGHQPMVDKSGRYAIVFNGEIFNYLELRAELEILGCVFQTQTDTEVILNAWIQWGRSAFCKFNGMWAIAIWDQYDRRLTLSRDRFGVKPLYIARQNKAIYFASEMKTLHAWPDLTFKPNKIAINEYLDFCILNKDEKTFWEGIQELKPSTWLEFDASGNEMSGKYWELKASEVNYKRGVASEEFARLFEDSLRLRMRSDVEVGALLSGGLDSNVIVAGLYKKKLITNNRFKSFSAIFSEEKFSEEKYIRKTLNKVPLVPYMVSPNPNDLQRDLTKLLYYLEEPFRSLSVYSQYKIYKCIKGETSVKVVLNGQGADEIFGGYTSHYYYFFIQLIRRGQYWKAIKEMGKFSCGRRVSYFRMAKQIVRIWLLTNGKNCFTDILLDEVSVSPLREYLKYDDRNSMSSSVEARTPFLDYRLVEFAFSLPPKYKIDNFINKNIERVYAKEIVSSEIVNRSDKMGFISPQEMWQKRELSLWFDQTFEKIKKHNTYFSGENAATLYQRYRSGKYKNWDHIWRYFCLMHWMEQHGVE